MTAEMVFEVDYPALAERPVPGELDDLLRLFDGRRTLGQVLEESAYGRDTARIFERLRRDGLLVEAQEPRRLDETLEAELDAWLDGDAAPAESPAPVEDLLLGAPDGSEVVLGASLPVEETAPTAEAAPTEEVQPHVEAAPVAAPEAASTPGEAAPTEEAQPTVEAAPTEKAQPSVEAAPVAAPEAASTPAEAAPVEEAKAPAETAAVEEAKAPVEAAPAPDDEPATPDAGAGRRRWLLIGAAAAAIVATLVIVRVVGAHRFAAPPVAALATAPAPVALPEPAPAEAAPAPAEAAPAPAAPATPDAIASAKRLVNEARAQLERGRAAQALVSAQSAASLVPDSADPWLLIGAAHQELEHPTEARAAYEKYLAIAPDGEYAAQLQSVLRYLR
jgi:hypothetical protein